jgi:hypothetical protein
MHMKKNWIAELELTLQASQYQTILGKNEKVQNYDQSFSQSILYGAVEKKITTLSEDSFSTSPCHQRWFQMDWYKQLGLVATVYCKI